jgi:hypothetical protein
MRSLLLLFLVLYSSTITYADENIITGETDHEYLPMWSEREVLLYEFSYLTNVANPTSYLTWSTTWNTNCIQQYGHQASAHMLSTDRDCSRHENAFRAARPFQITRVTYRTGATGTYDGLGWSDSQIRVVTVAPDGTITELGSPLSTVTGAGSMFGWTLADTVDRGTGVGLQLRATTSIAADDILAYPIVELWGIWK